MTKSRLFYLLALIAFLLIVSFTIITAINTDALIEKHNESENTNEEIGAAIGYALSLAILMVLLILCAIVYIIPTLYKIVVLIVNGKAVGIVSIVLDVIFTAAALVFTVSILINSSFEFDYSILWLSSCFLLSGAALVFDIIAVKSVLPPSDATEAPEGVETE